MVSRQKNNLFQVLGVVLIGVLGPSCSEMAEDSGVADRIALPGVVVDQEWLHANLARPGVLVIDGRPPEAYAAGHVAGAITLPSAALLDPDPLNATNLAPVDRIEALFGAAGISMEDTVVVYDDASFRSSARLFWALEVHGHPAVAVLDGGFAAWSAKGYAVSTEETSLAPVQFISRMQPERLATKLSVLRAIEDPSTVVLDSRSADEYTGAVSQAIRSGHIKSAVNVDFGTNVLTDEAGVCSFRPIEELRETYASLDPDAPVITYCNSGNRASVSYLALRSLGFDVAVYDGSWTEWGNDPSLPIEAPEP